MEIKKEQFILHVFISFLSLFLGISIFTFYILAFLHQREWVATLLANTSLLITAILQFISSILLVLTGFSFIFSWKVFSKFNNKLLKKIRENLNKEFKNRRKIILAFFIIVGIISVPLYFLNTLAYFVTFFFLTLILFFFLL